MYSNTLKDKAVAKEITRHFLVDGDDYEDYDGEEEEELPDDDWEMFNASFNW